MPELEIKRLLVANRSEIAIRVMRAANELGIHTIGIYSNEDRFALHRFKADESYQVGTGKKPIDAYLDIEGIVRIAVEAHVDAIHPGYGFLSENPDFAEACAKAGIEFIGPQPEVMRQLGNKVSARKLAEIANVPVMPATDPLPRELDACKQLAADIGYPVMLKASWGGGGRGMRIIESEADLTSQIEAARREAKAAFGNDEVYLEKLVQRARHVEVQILGDRHGNRVHLFERDCSVQRRHQKVIERAPAPYMNDEQRAELCGAALRLAEQVDYTHAGTIEFLVDADTDKFYFIEVNPRVQVEHTVTEEITGVDIVKAQILISQGGRIGDDSSGVPSQADLTISGHALQCRVTTEDPENNFVPDYGRILLYRSAAGFGVRLDAGTAYSGGLITPYYDSLLVKVTAWAPRSIDAINRMDRALREFRVRGLATNLLFLENVIKHPTFRAGECTTRFIDETPELFQFSRRRDRATRLLQFIGEVIVNGNPEVEGRTKPASFSRPQLPPVKLTGERPKGSRQRLDELGPERFAQWMKEQKQVLVTDTTLRDGHQSLFATRMRSHDMWTIAPYYAETLPQLFSLECWGGATFDVALRFLKEDPWERLAALRERVPNILFQMLLRGSNAVGYTNYPDNIVQHFVQQAATNGIDLFRVFDSLNWVENMRVAIDAVLDSGKLCEGTICYTGDLLDKNRPKYDLKYYIKHAKELEQAGVHILAIKDMAGVCKPTAAHRLVSALKQEISLPIHFHTHDTSGISAASVLAAIDAGVDAVDAAMDSMSGLTSQPNLGAIVAALQGHERDPGLPREPIRDISHYFEGVRRYYAAFESDIRSGTSDVYRHEMPGGQYTNLREQARSMGLENHWPEVAEMYAKVNELFGDIVKVTPTSKVVGDMALFMVTAGLTPADVLNPDRDINFPESVVSLFKGQQGFPPDGFPVDLTRRILNSEPPERIRPGANLEPADLDSARSKAQEFSNRELQETDVASYLMYPKVYADYAHYRNQFGNVAVLPTPVFFYGMQGGDEISVEIDQGKTLAIRHLATSEPDEEGMRRVFFELNGQPRLVRIADKTLVSSKKVHPKADDGNPDHVAAPMPGAVVSVAVNAGQKVSKGDVLVTLEAMKMETSIRAERNANVKEVLVQPGMQLESKDLLVVLGE